MAENYFPSAEDFDEMGDHLESIARLLADKVEVNDWASIQKAVRAGIAPNVLPVGTQLVVNHSVYGDIKLDVVAHNHYETADVKGGNSMTLMCHDIITSIRFDEREAFYYAEEELPAGTYHFYLTPDSSNAGQFTLDQPLLKGGQLFIYGNPSYSIDSSEILAYDYPTSQSVPRTYDITVGNGGVSLGTLGVELNQTQRLFYGSNNYKESAARQFVNSSAGAGSVWSPQTKYDFCPEWKDVLAGFANGFSEDFLSKVGRVVVPCSANNTHESSDSTVVKGKKYTVEDKFFLPSQTELFGTSKNIMEDGSSQLPFFKNASSADRVKYSGAYASRYWLRSAEYENAISVGVVDTNGYLIGRSANDSYGIVPMFNIV
jgi:hypothetical protein